MDTIFAQASARGKSGVAVIRVSGFRADDVCRALAGRRPPTRKATVCRLVDEDDNFLDDALVLVFESGGSFTGEAVVEFHVHGGRATVAAVLEVLGRMPGLRLAEPGEFTRRALTNGRLDLPQVEGLSDLIEAETEAQRKQAARVFGGEISAKVEIWRSLLVRALSLLAAIIDFSDEEIPDDLFPEVEGLIDQLAGHIGRELKGASAAERLRDGFEVAIVGRPNVGKSTLLNALAGRQAALTSEIAGTTRDVIEVRMDIAGLPVTLLDTAGIRDAKDQLEAAGVDLARQRAQAADLRVFVLETPGDSLPFPNEQDDITVVGKGDLHPEIENGISGKTGAGLDWVLDGIGVTLSERVAGASPVAHLRQRQALEQAQAGIMAARSILSADGGVELASEELRRAVHELEFLLGRVDVETVLGEIFSSFCIGK